jgi:sterol desaturase/sphingolipid hydroxylase (fatty acid hydroxylase superfamily)
MTDWIVTHDGILRASAFLTVFAAMAIAETIAEARPLRVARRQRWMHNLTLTAMNTVVLRLLFPAGAAAAAVWSAAHGTGLLRLVHLPPLAEMLVSIALLDLTIYAQHRLFHSVPLLFRFHSVHHADVDFDVTLGSRFHPVEMLLSMAIKLAAVVVIGASAAAVVMFELLLAVTSLFNHGNVRIPRAIDRVLRWLVVTPAMHLVHHSAERADRDSNFGFSIPWWDRLFRTYRERSAARRPVIGMPEHQSLLDQNILWMLALPFRSRRAPRPLPVETHQEAA